MAKKGTAFICEHCGTELVISKEGSGVLEKIVCCGTPTKVKEGKGKGKKK